MTEHMLMTQLKAGRTVVFTDGHPGVPQGSEAEVTKVNAEMCYALVKVSGESHTRIVLARDIDFKE